MNVKVKNRANKSTALYLAALSMSFFAEMTQANMSVYPMELNVDSSGTAQIRVASKSDDMVFGESGLALSDKPAFYPRNNQQNGGRKSLWRTPYVYQ